MGLTSGETWFADILEERGKANERIFFSNLKLSRGFLANIFIYLLDSFYIISRAIEIILGGKK